MSSGVPQGSILGCLLFITFMNSISDLPLSLGAKLVLYADDILLYKAVDSPNDVLLLQQDVNLILQWLHDHGLTPFQDLNSFKSPGQGLPLQFTSLSLTIHSTPAKW